ncbi:MAG TPA: PAS domain-containing protein, partial [Spongiibacteraceae bacterium]|nr:PAS domain-containing protein [Spongiibacteraceae bacterium]
MQWTSSSQEELRRAVRQEQLRLLFETQPFNIAATLMIAAIVALALTPAADRSGILLWCGFLVVGNIFRAAIAIAWRRAPDRLQKTEVWRRYMLIAAFLVGAGWGLCNFLLFPVQGPSQQMLLVFITCGISAAAAVSLAADPWIAWSFLIPCTLPLEWQLFTHANEFGSSLTAMGAVYLIFLAAVIGRQHQYISDNIALRIAESERGRQQSDIAQELRSSQEKLQALFELSPLGCMLTHADGRLIDANRALLQMLRFNEQEFPSFFNVGLSAPAQELDNRRRWYQLIQHGGTDAYECELVRRDG